MLYNASKFSYQSYYDFKGNRIKNFSCLTCYFPKFLNPIFPKAVFS